jgi:serine/threonine protein kinase
VAEIANGTILDGRYRLDRPIGAGGYATVYAGHHLALDIPVAIKVLNRPDAPLDENEPEAFEEFTEEVRLLTKLRHEGIVRTLDQGSTTIELPGGAVKAPYLVMEWCEGGTMKELVEAYGGRGVALAEAWPLMRKLIVAVAHAHRCGVVHRDLKPANVMLPRDASGELSPRVIDFGIAKLFKASPQTMTGETMTTSRPAFTAAYAAPEQVTGLRSGPWTDVHALALMFVELLTGEGPYESYGSMLVAAVAPERPTPRAAGLDVGPFEPVFARALALQPTSRYRNAGELVAAFDEAANAMGLATPGPTPPPAPSQPRAVAPEPSPGAMMPVDKTIALPKSSEVAAPSAPTPIPDATVADRGAIPERTMKQILPTKEVAPAPPATVRQPNPSTTGRAKLFAVIVVLAVLALGGLAYRLFIAR